MCTTFDVNGSGQCSTAELDCAECTPWRSCLEASAHSAVPHITHTHEDTACCLCTNIYITLHLGYCTQVIGLCFLRADRPASCFQCLQHNWTCHQDTTKQVAAASRHLQCRLARHHCAVSSATIVCYLMLLHLLGRRVACERLCGRRRI